MEDPAPPPVVVSNPMGTPQSMNLLHFETPLSMKSPPLPPRDISRPIISTPQEEDESFEVNEDSVLSYESVRPMGPKQLPMDHSFITNETFQDNEGESPLSANPSTYTDGFLPSPDTQTSHSTFTDQSLSSRSKNYPRRKFMNLLHGGSSPFVSDGFAENIKQEQEQMASLHIPPRPKGSVAGPNPMPSPPYPLDNSGVFELDDNQSLYNPYHDQSTNSPLRIPTLVGNNLLPSAPTTLDFSAHSPSLNYNASHSSPPIEGKSPLHESRYGLYDLPSSSPTRSSTTPSRPRSSYFYDNSRSPSPTKNNERPPWQVHDSSYNQDLSYDEANDSPEERIPRWSLLEAEQSDHYDETEQYTPASAKFDYSILPELPNANDTHLCQGDVITSVPPLEEAGELQRSSVTISRKHDSLPPVPLDLPRLPFSSSSLNAQHFAVCEQVWSLSSILAWCLKLKCWLHDSPISNDELKKALVKLVVFHKRSLPVDIINRNVNRMLETLIDNGAISLITAVNSEPGDPINIKIEENAEINSIFPELTDCYGFYKDHQTEDKSDKLLSCYSSKCDINRWIEQKHKLETTKIEDIELGADWASHWQLAAEDMDLEPSATKRQSFLFDLIKFEQKFIQRAECFVNIVGPDFIKTATAAAGASIVTSVKKFKEDIMNPAKDLLEVHKCVLMEPLLKLLLAEGRIIRDVPSIAKFYSTWSKSSTDGLLQYMSVVPMIEDILKNDILKTWDESLRLNPTVQELKVNGNMLLLSTFNSRYQQLPLQLSDIRKTYKVHEKEYKALTKAIEDIKKLGTKVNAMKVHADNIHALRRIEKQLTWKSNVIQPNLHLLSKLRKFFFRGNLNRKGDLKINTHAVHVIVLDNYILITEKSKGPRSASYKVVENPIPLDFVILENRERETGPLATITTPISGSTNNNNKEPESIDSDESSYPFKIRYAGRGKSQAYTFFATSESERKKWFTGILQARSNLLKKVKPLSPYDLQGMECAFFAYDHNDRMLKLPICPSNDPLQILSKETGLLLKQRGVRNELWTATAAHDNLVSGRVKCSELFTYKGVCLHLVGLTTGLYCSDLKNRWKRMLNVNNVTKISALPAFNVIIVLANKQLKYYLLPKFVDVYLERKETLSSTMLSNDQIQFYEIGRHRGVVTLFIAKKKNAGVTNFKVFTLETDNNGVFNSFFLIKRFYIQAECYGLNIFNTTIAVHTQRGFEVLDLQRLQPRTVPELPLSEGSNKKIDVYSRKGPQGSDAIRKALSHSGTKPMGMFKLNNNKEFLLVYSECAIFVNKLGKLSRNTMVRFDFKPRATGFQDNQLFIVNEEIIEIWAISDQAKDTNMLHQVIPGKDISVINPERMCFVAANPRKIGLQMVFYVLPKPPAESNPVS